MEHEISVLKEKDNKIELKFKAFEIITVKIRRKAVVTKRLC